MYVYICVSTHVCACICVCVCVTSEVPEKRLCTRCSPFMSKCVIALTSPNSNSTSHGYDHGGYYERRESERFQVRVRKRKVERRDEG